MAALNFNRVQIVCCDAEQAASYYSVLLGCEPIWQGYYSLQNQADTVVDSGSSVWFEFENTRLEFLCSNNAIDSEGADKAQITRLLITVDDMQCITTKLNVTCYQAHYQNASNSFVEEQFEFLDGDNSKRKIAVIAAPDAVNNSSLTVTNFSRQELPRVDHIVLYTNDAAASVKLFENDLSMRLALDKTVPEWGGRMLFLRCGKLTLEIIAPTEAFDGADYFWGLAYQVVDIDKTHQRLSAQGVSVSDVRLGRKPGTRVMTVKSHHLGVSTLLIEASKSIDPSVSNG